MKFTHCAIAAPLLLASLGSTYGAAAPSSPEAGGGTSFALQDSKAEQRNVKKDIKKLQAAEKVLNQRGYVAEAAKLREVIMGLTLDLTRLDDGKMAAKRAKAKRNTAAKKIEAGAKKLLKLDIGEPSTRVAMLDLIADGYSAVGNGASEEALRFFVSAANTPEGGSNQIPMPASLGGGEGPVMDQLFRVVESGAGAMDQLGCERGAEVCELLSQFYEDREAGRLAEPRADEPVAEEPIAEEPVAEEPESELAVTDLVTIERRAPILAWVADAYAGEDADPATAERMAWIAATAARRVSPGEVDVPAPVAFAGISQMIGDIERAGQIYLARGDTHRGQACLTLAEYYRQREAGEVADESATNRPSSGSQEIGVEGLPEPVSRALRGMGYAGEDRPQDSRAEDDLRARVERLREQVAALTQELTRMREELSAEDGQGR